MTVVPVPTKRPASKTHSAMLALYLRTIDSARPASYPPALVQNKEPTAPTALEARWVPAPGGTVQRRDPLLLAALELRFRLTNDCATG